MKSKQAERLVYAHELIEESEQLLRALTEVMPVAVFIIKHNKILHANRAATIVTGCTLKDLQNRETLTLLDASGRKVLLNHLDLSIPFDNMHSELRLVKENGEIIWINVNIVGMELRGEEVTIVAIEDINDKVSAVNMQKKLIQWIVEVQEEERRRLSRELHDQMGQDITALLLGLKNLDDSSIEKDNLREEIQKLQKITITLGHKVHQIAFELRPASIDDLGLLPTLQSYGEEWSRENGIPVEFEAIMMDNTDIPPDTTINIFRIVQEAFNNILKHAHPTNVSLIYEQKPDMIKVVIEDDGIGFDQDNIIRIGPGKQLGLLGMKERAEIAGGSLVIESGPGKGTTLFLSVPLPSVKEVLNE